jgi:hypothetical protein
VDSPVQNAGFLFASFAVSLRILLRLRPLPAHLLLKRLHLAAHRALRERELIGGKPKVEVASNGDQGAQMASAHGAGADHS